MYHIIGLQNNPPTEPGKYEHTPHNIGGEVLSLVADEVGSQVIQSKTYMNRSGDNLNRDLRQSQSEHLIVVRDDVDLSFGEIKIVTNKGDGGHNGVKDIIQKMGGKNFIQIKIGVCPLDFFGRCRKPSKEGMNQYLVHKRLSKKYLKKYPELGEKVKDIIQTITSDGLQKAMNRFN